MVAFLLLMQIVFVYEIEGTTSEIFYKYLEAFSLYKLKEIKIIIIDNASFYSVKNIHYQKT